MIGFCVANAMKILDVDFMKILACSLWLLLVKKLTNFLRYFLSWGHSKTTLGILIKHGLNFLLFKEMIIGWWIDDFRFTTGNFWVKDSKLKV